MKREFFQPVAPFHPGIIFRNTLHPGIVYRDKGELDWKPLDSMPENEQVILLMKLKENFIGQRHVTDAVHKGAKTPFEILRVVIPRIWGKLNCEFDIDEDKLNFETI